MDFKGKIKALKKVFFPPLPLVDLVNVEGANYLKPIAMNSEITLKEIKDIIWYLMADKASGISGILNRFLKVICAKMTETFKKIFQVCLNCGYHLKKFQEINIVILKKPKKANYLELKAYRPIVLLDTLKKTLKTIIAKHLNRTAKRNHLLPEHQIGGRKGRSMEITLKTIIDLIHTI